MAAKLAETLSGTSIADDIITNLIHPQNILDRITDILTRDISLKGSDNNAVTFGNILGG